jgi:hypothetical protein
MTIVRTPERTSVSATTLPHRALTFRKSSEDGFIGGGALG